MKKSVFLKVASGAVTAVLLLFLAGCYQSYEVYVPQVMSYQELRSSVRSLEPSDMEKPGKIWFYRSWLLVNEVDRGVHVIDISDPSAPVPVSFINIPGCRDMAVQDDILYADSYVDFVAIDIGDPANAREVKRIEDIFTRDAYSLIEEGAPWLPVEEQETEGVVTAYTVETRHEWNVTGGYGMPDTASGAAEGGSRGGSMARFALYDRYLYAVIDGFNLQIFQIEQPADPRVFAKTNIGWNIETVFPYDHYMFFGAEGGMYIYDLTDPANPEQLSVLEHVRARDPVVTDGAFAYVTLREAQFTDLQYSNTLLLIDLADIRNPSILRQYAMQGPYGLGLNGAGTGLFICDGAAGLKVYEVGDNPDPALKKDLILLTTLQEENPLDVIPAGNILFVTREGGISVYDIGDLNDITLLSTVQTQQP